MQAGYKFMVVLLDRNGLAQQRLSHNIRATCQQYALSKILLNQVYNVCGTFGDQQHELGLAWISELKYV